jgi:tRNA(Ile)-lysidine synthetase-like protein
VSFGGYRICVRAGETPVQGPHCFTVYTDGEITVRSRRSGDAITVSGGTKSLKKLMIDRKIPSNLRDQLPVLEDAKGILGVHQIGADLSRQDKSLPGWIINIE